MADPTDPTRADRPVGVAEARRRAVIDAAVDGIIVIDARGRIEVFNRAAQGMFDYAESDLTGRNVSMLMPEPDHSRHDGYLKHHLDTGERRIIGIGRAVTGRRRDGTTFPPHLSVGEMTIDGDRHFTGIFHDLSRRHELEDQLREATALARVGEMAAVNSQSRMPPWSSVHSLRL